jgi:hypothetical protein
MPIHLDVLGRLHVILGGFAALAGASLLVLAGGTSLALSELEQFIPPDGVTGPDAAGQAGVWILGWCGVLIIVAGAALALTGRALARRRPAGRIWALAIAVPNLLVVPFGTALSIYAFWVLLNDEARREFGRPPRITPHPAQMGGA